MTFNNCTKMINVTDFLCFLIGLMNINNNINKIK